MESKTVEQLKNICRKKGLKISGNKSELILRIKKSSKSPKKRLTYGMSQKVSEKREDKVNSFVLSSPTETYIGTGKILGKGAFGVVYEGYNSKSMSKLKNPDMVAIKYMKDRNSFEKEYIIAEFITAMFRKYCGKYISCIKDTIIHDNHHFIVYSKAYSDLHKWMIEKGANPYVYFFSGQPETRMFNYEYMNNLTQKEKYVFIKSMLSSLSFYIKNGIIHRDIKIDNILVYKDTKHGTDDIMFIIADYGLLCLDAMKQNVPSKFSSVKCKSFGQVVGTEVWMPRRLQDNYKNIKQQYLVDIYAMGCTLYTFLTGILPQTMNKDLRLFEYPSDIVYDGNIIKKEDISSLILDMIYINSFDEFFSRRDPMNFLKRI